MKGLADGARAMGTLTGGFPKGEGATSEAASRIEIHQSVISNEVARMKKREKVSIPAGETLILAPKGMHLMLLEPAALSEGDEVQIELQFDPGKWLEVRAPVRRAPSGDEDGSHHPSGH